MTIVVLTGAGISAESGITTFRDSNGLWENHRIEDVATPEGWKRNPALVLDFYNQRRRQLFDVAPNAAHLAITALQEHFDVQVITQNVDDLHERAGNNNVLHLHGALRKVRSEQNPDLVFDWEKDLHLGDLCPLGSQLRPHIVWFGEEVPMLPLAARMAEQADVFLIVGTSLQVYPAASLMVYADPDIPFYYIDPNPQVNYELAQKKNLIVLEAPATVGVPQVVEKLIHTSQNA